MARAHQTEIIKTTCDSATHVDENPECSQVNYFGITLSENHFKCAMGSTAFELQCRGEEEGLGNISKSRNCDPSFRTIQCACNVNIYY